MSRFTLLSVLLATSAFADAGWLSARGRLEDTTRLEIYGGTRALGFGIVRPDEDNRRAAITGEIEWGFLDKASELRGARVWQLTNPGTVTLSAALGGAFHLVPVQFDIGLGPTASFTASFGSQLFHFDLGLQTSAELFVRGTLVRLPERLLMGFNLRLGDWGVSLQGRAGVDIVVGSGFLGRAEAVLSVAWFGLERARARVQ